MRETPGAETYGPMAWDDEAEQSRVEGVRAPSRRTLVSDSFDDGWRPWEPLHRRVYEWVSFARLGGKVPGIMAAAADVPWPWCAASLQEHVALVAAHFLQAERIAMEERRMR